jgi:dipeptidyl aminopeptidase/acylaminoacyl peptidase
MPNKRTAPYGGWRSPLSSSWVASSSVGLGQIMVDGSDIYWLEQRPEEGGRSVVVQYKDGIAADLIPGNYSARNRVHEYGGAAYTVSDKKLYFSNDKDQNIYQINPGQPVKPVRVDDSCRYADFQVDKQHNRLIAVCEDHSQAGLPPVNTLVSIGLAAPSTKHNLASGRDFYASPRLSPDGSQIAWLSWDHPAMPWDGCELWIADIKADGLHQKSRIAGGKEVSIFQPRYSPDGTLYFVSDQSGWWNLYRWRNNDVECVLAMEAEFGLPQWQFGLSTYAFLTSEAVLCVYCEQGRWKLGKIDVDSGKLMLINTHYTDISSMQATAAGMGVFIAASPTQTKAVVSYDSVSKQLDELQSSGDITELAGYLSIPEPVSYLPDQNQYAHGFYYPPVNKEFMGEQNSLPPLIVKSHGGPTAAATTAFNPKIQFWTSRGFAVLDVNYGGSTGYGRAYRHRLDANWGIVDVADCVAGAMYLVDKHKADPRRLIMTGSSAGGYTVLSALTFTDTFSAGSSYYGISELEALVRDTHKFESRYLDRLIGRYPDCSETYKERSPIYHADQLSCPVIFFQGLEDKVVPPGQTKKMVEVLMEKGIGVAYVTFDNEQHGFRRAGNIRCALDNELFFYSRVFGIPLVDELEPIKIYNCE